MGCVCVCVHVCVCVRERERDRKREREREREKERERERAAAAAAMARGLSTHGVSLSAAPHKTRTPDAGAPAPVRVHWCCVCVKRDLCLFPKRPMSVSKETCASALVLLLPDSLLLLLCSTSATRCLRYCSFSFSVSKETYVCVERDLCLCQKRPVSVSKETCVCVKRDRVIAPSPSPAVAVGGGCDAWSMSRSFPKTRGRSLSLGHSKRSRLPWSEIRTRMGGVRGEREREDKEGLWR